MDPSNTQLVERKQPTKLNTGNRWLFIGKKSSGKRERDHEAKDDWRSEYDRPARCDVSI